VNSSWEHGICEELKQRERERERDKKGRLERESNRAVQVTLSFMHHLFLKINRKLEGFRQ
jgi:hypothetical protein